MKYKYLIALALQEELNEFLNLVPGQRTSVNADTFNQVFKVTLKHVGKEVEILTFTYDTMGMPLNAAKLMQIVLEFKPLVTLFIGICAGISDYPLGTVLIPERVFTYESGKYKDGVFRPDHKAHETSEWLRREANLLSSRMHTDYMVITGEEFCSGAAVIDDPKRIIQILDLGSRKLSGLDMEAYSIACIQSIVRDKCKLLVIKGISDMAKNKEAAEKAGARQEAMRNSAQFALELIKHLELSSLLQMPAEEELEIRTYASIDPEKHYPFKLSFNIKNTTTSEVTIKSVSFILGSGFKLQKDSDRDKPLFFVRNIAPKDVYNTDIFTLRPNEEIKECWLPIDSSIGNETFERAVMEKKIGVWKYQVYSLKGKMIVDSFSKELFV